MLKGLGVLELKGFQVLPAIQGDLEDGREASN